ncbi:composite domain of metallo-dependent hydrolase [Cristinia sonorae]|uniref:Composite domain of metallo-dependent hydrolase n=1 Tax=Cristinia sonorae TaxID=1940300 RepID=A0A8K0UEA4_9AGAR|nr:composite domain of metallo-dependent hydrolase [Cristinia sonorae]
MGTKPNIPDDGLPIVQGNPPQTRRRTRQDKVYYRVCISVILGIAAFNLLGAARHAWNVQGNGSNAVQIPLNAAAILDTCRSLNFKPGPPPDFNERKVSDRFVQGTGPVLIKNATIWTGRVEGLEEITGDLLLESGIIKAVGHADPSALANLDNLVTVDADGAWVTPGIVDLHSHIGVTSSPYFSAANDGNSPKGPILPWLRVLDALNTHNDAYRLSVAGGVTTALVLPGSANAIAGQAIVVKYRPSTSRSPIGLIVENPYSTNNTEYAPEKGLRWKHMKHACGENPNSVYHNTRMDTVWAFRQAYNKARDVKNAQDAYCSKARAGQWAGLGEFPTDYQWDPLVDVLRGRVKVHIHCYETVDLDDLVRITNEFHFPIAAFHHALETYLVPDTLKAAYGGTPAAALFATIARTKRETWRGSEFAPKILADNGIEVIIKSDHPVLNSRYLMFEAQQAHYYGLPRNLALASVTTVPVRTLGLEHRVGYIKVGYDADIVLWDSHPLALGATPQQVWIDGIPQLETPTLAPVKKSKVLQKPPHPPNFGKEAEAALKYEGLPPLIPARSTSGVVVFTNFNSVYTREGGTVRGVSSTGNDSVFVVQQGKVVCRGLRFQCADYTTRTDTISINLHAGSISPGLVSFGSPLGLEEIANEDSTNDGYVHDSIFGEVPTVLGIAPVVRAVDGLQFSTRNALVVYRSGVTTAITAPQITSGILAGLSVAFSTGAEHKLKEGALVQDIVALHVSIHHSGVPSISTQIGALRNLLLGNGHHGHITVWADKVVKGDIPLVIDVSSADAMASLIQLKYEVEEKTGHALKVTFTHASEAAIVAPEIAKANIGVIVTPSRPFPDSWEDRRILPGPPLTSKNIISTLLSHNITVGVGVVSTWQARNTRFDIAWAALDARGGISPAEALALASVNIETLLGVKRNPVLADLVATDGGDLLGFEGKVVAVISPSRGVVDIL